MTLTTPNGHRSPCGNEISLTQTTAYSTKHLLYQRSCNTHKTITPSSTLPTSPPTRELPLAREKGKSCGGGVVGSWLFPPRRLKGRTAVSELNITYVVERSLYGHLNWTGLVRPVTLSKADRRWLLEDERDANRKWASSMDRCTKRVLLRIQQKSVSVPEEQIYSAPCCTGGTGCCKAAEENCSRVQFGDKLIYISRPSLKRKYELCCHKLHFASKIFTHLWGDY